MPNIFAVIVGIDKYLKISPLHGCVDDAQSFRSYLMNHQNVPARNIRTLFNEEANRKGIIEAFQSFARNAEMREDDVIVLYFAGHSHISTLTASERDHEQAQTICPVDAQVPYSFIAHLATCTIQCIPLNDLVSRLSIAQRNGIVVILDSSHAGGVIHHHLNQVPRSIFPFNPTRLSWLPKLFPVRAKSAISHTLFAARSMADSDILPEHPTDGVHDGCFSSILIAKLSVEHSSFPTSSIAPHQLANSLVISTDLRLKCHRLSKNHYLFDVSCTPKQLPLSRVDSPTNELFRVEIGRMHKVIDESEFDVFHNQTELGVLVVKEFDQTSSILSYPSQIFDIPDGACVIQRQDSLSILDVCVDASCHSKLDHIFSSKERKFFRRVYSLSKAHIVLSLTVDEICVERKEPLMKANGKKIVTFSTAFDSRIRDVLDNIGHFRHELGRYISPENRLPETLSTMNPERFVIRIHSLGHTSNGFRTPEREIKPKNGNLFEIEQIDNAIYGIEIINKSACDVFPYAFYFDTNDYSIQLWNHPENEAEPPLRCNNSNRCTIGYGERGGDPISFEASDIGFLKLVVSDRYVDFSSVESSGVNQVTRRESELEISADTEILGAWVVGIIVPN